MNAGLRIWALVSGAAVVAVLAGGWFMGVQPQLAAAATASQSAAGLEAQNDATRTRLAELSRAAAKTDSMQSEDAELLKSVPTVLKPNTFIRRVGEVAAIDGVTVQSISPGAAVPYTQPVAATGAAAALALGTTNPLINGADFTAVPMTVVVSGSADATTQFTHDIQDDERTFAVTGFQSSKDDTSATVTTTLNGYIYTLKR